MSVDHSVQECELFYMYLLRLMGLSAPCIQVESTDSDNASILNVFLTRLYGNTYVYAMSSEFTFAFIVHLFNY